MMVPTHGGCGMRAAGSAFPQPLFLLGSLGCRSHHSTRYAGYLEEWEGEVVEKTGEWRPLKVWVGVMWA